MNKMGHILGKNMGTINRHLKIYLKHKLKKYDNLNPSQFLFILTLSSEDGISQEKINTKLKYDKGVMTRITKDLERLGYIMRKTNSRDRRENILFLTDKAKDFKTVMMDILNEWNESLLVDMEDDIIRLLTKNIEIMALRAIKKSEDVIEGSCYNE